jgi:hypothetical protein
MNDEDLLARVLDEVEQRESRLLSWGLVDGFVGRDELVALIDDILDQWEEATAFNTAEAVIDALRARALLFDVGADGDEWRSRMAETVRLSFRLRQLFPQHRGPNGWRTAPTLVGDFRFLWRRRRYPRREIELARAMADISAATSDAHVQGALGAFFQSLGARYKLARFQLDAASRILSGLEGNRSTATLVSAGTGSGKTLAFYIPALARVAKHVARDTAATRWVKVLAVYPRNELLKDQFAEVYAQSRRLDDFLQAAGRRKILIGAFFGPTPKDGAAAAGPRGWHRRGDGLVCEYVRCPGEGCAGDMIWLDPDRTAGRERLQCDECARAIESDEVILTRGRLASESPDILFTTTEMLNQRMGDNRYRHLFGVGAGRGQGVELMLLDEVHTYAGASGAQVAYLLRRWRRMLGSPVSFVGLSATLAEGQQFFARLTGLSEQATAEIAPSPSEHVSEGAEYLLALRGDPVSRAALLSTTIQTAMLMSRMLDAPASQRSRGLYGERIFLFTDDIDVTNRMYFAMLDAEGRSSNGAMDMARHPNGGLASLRSPLPSQSRKLHGQDWEAAVGIGHALQAQDRKRIGRVMSLDPGVGGGDDIVVATASLEVGFNDVRVGGVIQHKAPRDVAQFLQRKGRAGRSRRMRPWTVVVLSDYGRDRLAYQGYDLLFDPEVRRRSLPIANRHIQRMQAIYATLDYLSQFAARVGQGSAWTNFAMPGGSNIQRSRQREMARRIREILTTEPARDRYAQYLARALRLSAEEINLILWEQPRPLLLEALPTALRRLESNWAMDGREGTDFWTFNAPLPEFAPANLFSDLNLPEVTVTLPPQGGVTRDPVQMPIVQAMKEFAPGRVSRRYGLANAFDRHTFPVVFDQNRVQSVALDGAVEGEQVGVWLVDTAQGPAQLPIWRARAFRVQTPAAAITDTSNAQLYWRTQIVARSAGLECPPPRASAWSPLVHGLHFFTHQSGEPLEVRRMATGSEADIRFQDGRNQAKTFVFERSGSPAGLGFSLMVDGLCLRLELETPLWQRVSGSPELARTLRTARFHDEAVRGAQFTTIENPFARGWLAQLMIAALSNEAIAKQVSLVDAALNLRQGGADLDLAQTLNILFQSPVIDDAGAQVNLQDRLRQELSAYIADPQVFADLFQLSTLLSAPVDASWEPWLRERFGATVGAAALSAIVALCPDVDGEGLVVDIDRGPRDQEDVLRSEHLEVWITETAPGGNGHIEQALEQYAEDPSRFYRVMSAALGETEFAASDFQLRRFLDCVGADSDGALARAARDFRQAYGSSAAAAALARLRALLATQGLAPFHTFMTALGNRVLRPGSSADSDRFLHNAMALWDHEEARLGVELEARTIAYRLSRNGDIDAALGEGGVDAPTINADQWRLSVIYGLLWPRGASVRQAALALYSPFATLPATETLLARAVLDVEGEIVDIASPTWQDESLARLADAGAVTLRAPAYATAAMAQAINFFATNPVQSDYLSVYARVDGLRREGDQLLADLNIAEALQ